MPNDETDPLIRLLQAYAAAPPSEPFVQSLGQRLEQELARSVQVRAPKLRRWRRLGLAVAASLLVAAGVAVVTSWRGSNEGSPATTPAVIRHEPGTSPQTIKDDIVPTR
jgi:hypothetical protein